MDIIKIDNLKDKEFLDSFISKSIKDNILDVEVVYSSLFENSKILRDFVEQVCNRLGFSNLETNRLVLVVDELNNNAIEYGSEKGGTNKLRLKTIINKDSFDFFLEVEDSGKGESHKTALEMETMRAHKLKKGYDIKKSFDFTRSNRGRGLFMITLKSVDRLYFRDSQTGGLIVGVKKNIKI